MTRSDLVEQALGGYVHQRLDRVRAVCGWAPRESWDTGPCDPGVHDGMWLPWGADTRVLKPPCLPCPTCWLGPIPWPYEVFNDPK